MKNITVATKEGEGYYNILVESCKRNNIELVVLGLGMKWTGFTMRFKLWLDYLKNLDDNEIVMINDAYDVVITEEASVIEHRFKEFNKKVVFGTQDSLMSNLVFSKCMNTILCCGNMIGYVKYLKIIINTFYKYKELWIKYNNDDQLVLNDICNKNPFFREIVGADIKRNLFFVVSDDNRYFNKNYITKNLIKDLDVKNGKLINTNLNRTVCVLHLSALMNGNYYLKKLNYNVDKVKLNGFVYYKFQQFLNLYLKYILFFVVIIIFLLLISFKKQRKLIFKTLSKHINL